MFATKSKMTADHLQLLLTLWKDVTTTNIMMLMIIFSNCYIQLFNVMGLFILFREEDNDPLRYLAIFSISQAVTTYGCIVLERYKRMDRFQRLTIEYSLPINSFGKETERDIQAYCKKVETVCIIFCIIYLLIVLACLTYTSFVNQPDISLVALVIETYFIKFAFILKTLHLLSYIVSSYIIPVCVIYTVYCVNYLKVQMWLLKVHLTKLCQDIDDFGLIENEEYQYKVTLILKEVVVRHLNIRKLGKEYLLIHYGAVFWIVIMGTMFLVGNTYFLKMRVSPENDFRALLMVLVGTVTLLILAWLGQILQDEGESFFATVIRCSWIVWNVKNRKLYLFFMANCVMPVKLSAFGLLDVDATLVIKIVNMTYKVLLCFVQLQQKQNFEGIKHLTNK